MEVAQPDAVAVHVAHDQVDDRHHLVKPQDPQVPFHRLAHARLVVLDDFDPDVNLQLAGAGGLESNREVDGHDHHRDHYRVLVLASLGRVVLEVGLLLWEQSGQRPPKIASVELETEQVVQEDCWRQPVH